MADSVKIALRNQYFSLPTGPIKTAVGREFTRIYGVTPEQDLFNQESSQPVSTLPPVSFGLNTQVLDTSNNPQPSSFAATALNAAAAAAAAAAAPPPAAPTTPSVPFTPPVPGFQLTFGGSGPSLVDPNQRSTPVNPIGVGTPTDPENQKVECDYRYDFGCPVFSAKPDGSSGCNVFMPISRICIEKPNLSTGIGLGTGSGTGSGGGRYFPPEFLGYINVTNYSKSALGETIQNYIQNGVKGTLTTYETQFDESSIDLVIAYLKQFINASPTGFGLTGGGGTRTFEDKYVDRGDGVIVKASVSLDNFNLSNIVANLYNSIYQTPTLANGFVSNPPLTLDKLGENLKKWCKFESPTFCKYPGIFEPDPPPPPPAGPFIDRSKKVEVFGSRKPNGRKFSRPLDPNAPDPLPVAHPTEPCALAIIRKYEEGDFFQATLAFAEYSNPNFTGPVIGYHDPEPAPEYPVVSNVVDNIQKVPGRNPDCKFVIEETPLKEIEDPNDNCRVLQVVDIYKVYENGDRELESRDVFRGSYRKQDAECSVQTVKVYHPMDMATDMMTAKIRAKTKGLFDGAQSLTCHHTSSTQPTASKKYYYDVTDCDSCGKTAYFSVAYGNNKGSGSLSEGGELEDTATRAIYSQCRLLALDTPETEFTFYTNGVATSSRDVYVINFSRIGMSDRIDPGNWELALSELSGSFFANSVHTGSNVKPSTSNKILTFIDNSGDTSEQISTIHEPYNSYDIISGSLTNGTYTTASRHTYGMVYPNLGIMVLDPYKLNTELGFNTVTGSNIDGDNAYKLFTSISGSGNLGYYMKARNVKYKTTNHYIVRVPSTLANFSNNPTWVSGSNGEFLHPSYKINPQAYITAVGLYNDSNELIAVAKLSKPINKSFENDVLIKIRLNW